MEGQEFYSERFRNYEDWYRYSADNLWYTFLITKILKNIDTQINSVLDVGCGNGNRTVFMSKYFSNATCLGIDYAISGIEYANHRHGNISNCSFACVDVTDNAILDNLEKFDIVCSFEFLEHIDDWRSTLTNIADKSKKYILLSFPSGRMREYEKSIGHLRNFKRGEVEDFFTTNGFKVVKTYYAGFPFFTPLARDIRNKLHTGYEESISHKFSSSQKIFHYCCYIVFKYFTFKSIGDKFVGLFERI